MCGGYRIHRMREVKAVPLRSRFWKRCVSHVTSFPSEQDTLYPYRDGTQAKQDVDAFTERHAPAAEAPGGSRKLKTALHELRALLSQCRLQQGTDSYGLRNQSVDLLDLSFGNMTPTLGRWPPLRIFSQN